MLVWVGLCCVGLGWAGLCWVVLVCVGLGWAGLGWAGQVTVEIRSKAPESFLSEHMADVKAWSVASIAKSLSKHRLVDL